MECSRCLKTMKEGKKVPHPVVKDITLHFCMPCAHETGNINQEDI